MKNRFLQAFLFSLAIIGAMAFTKPEFQNDNQAGLTETYVYICKGPYSTKYHLDQNCRGLNNCSTDIYEVTKVDAIKKYERTLCGHED